MNRRNKRTFIILAGGKNSRFLGRDKAFIRVLGKPMIERVIEAGIELFEESLIVSNSPEKFNAFKGIKIVGDIIPDAGPIGGLHAGLKESKGESLMMVSCDMPFLSQELISRQLEVFVREKGILVIPRAGGLFEPLHAIFSKEILHPLEKHLLNSSERKLIDFYLSRPHRIWDVNIEQTKKNPFLNINSYEDLEVNGIHGYIGILGFGKDVPEKNLLLAGQTGKLIAEAGWGILTGNTGGTFRVACTAVIENGGLAKLVYSREDITSDDSLWPLKIEVATLEEKHQQMSQLMGAAIVLGGGQGTRRLIQLLVQMGKIVICINHTEGVTEENLPGCLHADTPEIAVALMNRLLLKKC